MRDYNIVVKTKPVFEKLGWIIRADGMGDWIVGIHTPCGEFLSIKLSNRNFLQELEDLIRDFDINEEINKVVVKLLENDDIPNYSNILSDYKWYLRKLEDLYKRVDKIDEFHDDDDEDEEDYDGGDTGEESKESDS